MQESGGRTWHNVPIEWVVSVVGGLNLPIVSLHGEERRKTSVMNYQTGSYAKSTRIGLV